MEFRSLCVEFGVSSVEFGRLGLTVLCISVGYGELTPAAIGLGIRVEHGELGPTTTVSGIRVELYALGWVAES